MSRCAIIVAGGSGTRMGSAVPKQFLLINGLPILAHTLHAFHRADSSMQIVLVLPADQVSAWNALVSEHGISVNHMVVTGGVERSDSVQNGLKAIGDQGAVVAVHDGVRPLVSAQLITHCFTEAQTHGSAIPVTPISSSVRTVTEAGNQAVDRSSLRTVQTPQCFQREILEQAFADNPGVQVTDEASLVELNGHPIHLIDGEETNIKITTPHDLRLAEVILSA